MITLPSGKKLIMTFEALHTLIYTSDQRDSALAKAEEVYTPQDLHPYISISWVLNCTKELAGKAEWAKAESGFRHEGKAYIWRDSGFKLSELEAFCQLISDEDAQYLKSYLNSPGKFTLFVESRYNELKEWEIYQTMEEIDEVNCAAREGALGCEAEVIPFPVRES